MMNPVKILLGDLAYTHLSEYIHPIPLNVGYIGAYLKQAVHGVQIDIFKNPEDLYRALNETVDYDVVALSNYDWNVNLDRQFLKMIKRKYPRVVTVMGGPNVNDESDRWMRGFFLSMPDLDFYVVNEGEYKFARLVQSLIDHDMEADGLWPALPPSVRGLDRRTGDLLRGAAPEMEKCDCASLPSPYLTGLLDKFLDDPHLVPIIETNRGCPYSCAFCCWGKAINSKIRQFSQETVVREIEYIAARTKNPIRSLYIADANFGIFKRDVEIAQILKEHSVKEGFPQNIYMYFAKNTDEKVLKVAEMLRGLTDISMSKQSLNKEVLKIIGRDNISDEKYDATYARLRELGASSYCELIYGLPGETLESFLDGFETIAQRRLRPVLYPLILIRGSEIDSDAFRENYQIRTAFRIIPRYTGTYHDVNAVEYEEVVISHKDFSQDDFFHIRLIQFLYWIFSESIFAEFVKFINEHDLNVVSCVRFLLDDRPSWPRSFEALVTEFERDARAEMIDKKDLNYEVTRKEIEGIRNRGLALNIWHFCRLIAASDTIESFKSYLMDATRRFFLTKSAAVDEMELDFVLMASFDKIPRFPEIEPVRVKKYPYDLQAWLADHARDATLSRRRAEEEMAYKFEFEPELLELFWKKLGMYDSVELALYYFRMDFIAAPYRAYTYKRMLIESNQALSVIEERLLRDLPQSVRSF